MQRTLRGRRRRRPPRNRTGCYECKKHHNRAKVTMIKVKQPGDVGVPIAGDPRTAHVCEVGIIAAKLAERPYVVF